jgi:hypothetical protein
MIVLKFYPRKLVLYKILLARWHRNQINKIKSYAKWDKISFDWGLGRVCCEKDLNTAGIQSRSFL